MIARLLFFLLISMWATIAHSEDLYFSQGGGGAGTSCGSSFSAANFNDAAGFWGSGAGKITAGDTAHLCGTITSELIARGSGSAGNIITILFETSAKIQHPTFCNDACIDITNKSYLLVDGGTTCGYVNRVNTACNGKILNTTAHATSNTFGVKAGGCNNCEIRNLEIGPLYTKEANDGFFPINNTNVRGVDVAGGPSPGNTLKTHHNYIHDTSSGQAYAPGVNNEDGIQFYNNYCYRNNSCLDISNNPGGPTRNMMGALFHDNHVSGPGNWDDGGSCNGGHHNSLHAFATLANGGTNNNVDVYNNLTDGDWGTCATAQLFIEGGADGANRNFRVFNNVFAASAIVANCHLGLWGDGALLFVSNTLITPTTNTIPLLCTQYSSGLTIENNVLLDRSNKNLVVINTPNPTVTAWDYNQYEQNNVHDPFAWNCNSCIYGTFGTWQVTFPLRDTHSATGINGYMRINTTTGAPQAGSPVIGTGVNLTSLGIAALNSDINGIARPASAAWDVGAIQFAATTSTIRFMSGGMRATGMIRVQ